MIIGAFAVAPLWPMLARAQRPPKLWRVGYLGVQSKPQGSRYYEAFQQAMHALGYVEGKTLLIEWRFAEGDYERLPGLAADLVNRKVDVIVASSTPAIAAAQRATTAIPIVMGVTGDPVGAGFVKTLARPGGNITGTSAPGADYVPKQLEFLRRIVPKLSRVGVLLNPGNLANTTTLQSVESTARKLGIRVTTAEARTPAEIDSGLAAQHQQGAEAVMVLPDGLFLQRRGQIAQLAKTYRLPTMYQLREHVEVGGLISYGQDLIHNHRLAATYVDKIFRGAHPGDLPVEQASKLELVVNRKTATAFGISIPKDVLFLADTVID